MREKQKKKKEKKEKKIPFFPLLNSGKKIRLNKKKKERKKKIAVQQILQIPKTSSIDIHQYSSSSSEYNKLQQKVWWGRCKTLLFFSRGERRKGEIKIEIFSYNFGLKKKNETKTNGEKEEIGLRDWD